MPSGPGDHAVVTCRSVTKRYGAVVAVDAVDLEVRAGEILALLGPSGCGKTTTLRLVAGFERPDEGEVYLEGLEVASASRSVPPERRRIGMVFQDYALFPHLSVAGNVGYGVKARDRRAERVTEVLRLVGLESTADQRPHELSGGQQQRVTLARALAPEPAIVLLDEPFSNLDAALRAELRGEVRAILRRAGATAVFVTHDQEEALSLADRVAVMDRGRILQIGRPVDVYERPTHPFVASFVGDADLLWGESDGIVVRTELGAVTPVDPVPPGRTLVVVRGESLRVRLDGSGRDVVRSTTFYGHDQVVEVDLASGVRVRARTVPSKQFEPGDRVRLGFRGPVVAFPVGDEIDVEGSRAGAAAP